MRTHIRFSVCVLAAAAAYAVGAHADTPHIYAITGARLVTAAGAPIDKGTIVIRNGVIDAVGADVQAPPDAIAFDGTGMTVYPGLIDMGTATGISVPSRQAPQFRTTEEEERWKRENIFRPQLQAADYVQADSEQLARLAGVGITTVLATPAGALFRGQSALLNVSAGEDEPQIGAVADVRKGLNVVRTPVALHVSMHASAGRGGYPGSLLGNIAFVRQHFIDAQHQQRAQEYYEQSKNGGPRPSYDAGLDALEPALSGRVPVAFEADLAREIRRSLKMASEFNLDPIITSAREADLVVADLKAQNARVIYSLNYPTRPRDLSPDADEPLRTLRTRAHAPKTPAGLAEAGILFAFASDGVREPRDFVRNASKAVQAGLPSDAAVRALTINAAKIAGVDARLGSLEKGKIANVIVTEGDLFEDDTRVRHVFVDGRLVDVNVSEPPANGRGRGRGGN